MWAYKLDSAINHLGMTRTPEALRKVIHDAYIEKLTKYQTSMMNYDPFLDVGAPIPANTPALFDRDVEMAQDMARALGWDGTLHELRCYLVPDLGGYAYGFVLTQATSGQRFLVSPVPLAYLEEHVNWDAHTSLEEVQRARAALEGKPLEPPPLTWSGEWKRSRAGNQYCIINGAQVTIFPSKREAGFCAVIASQTTGLKVFTRTCPTELDCARYVFEHFYTLVKPWSDAAETRDDNDNPFAGVDWGDDA